MNALTRDLIKLVDMTEEMMKEKEQKEGTAYREQLHLMPPVGWLNDPNGLCQLNGIYHAFFQYSPFNAEGGVKMWGHYTSKDMIDWEYQGVKLYPDQPFDWCYVNPNTMICVAAVLCYEKSFGEAIAHAVTTGFDTDCNGATVGSILGMRGGFHAIEEKWTEDLEPVLHSSISRYEQIGLEEAVMRTMKLL